MFTSIIMLGWVLPCTTKNAEKNLFLGTSSLAKIQHLHSSKKSWYRVDIITRRSLLPPNMSSHSSLKQELRIYMYFCIVSMHSPKSNDKHELPGRFPAANGRMLRDFWTFRSRKYLDNSGGQAATFGPPKCQTGVFQFFSTMVFGQTKCRLLGTNTTD